MTVSDEAEFERLLAATLERQRLSKETGARDARMQPSLEAVEKNAMKETQHHDEER